YTVELGLMVRLHSILKPCFSNLPCGLSAGLVSPRRKRKGSAKVIQRQCISAKRQAPRLNVDCSWSHKTAMPSFRHYICPSLNSAVSTMVGESHLIRLDS